MPMRIYDFTALQIRTGQVLATKSGDSYTCDKAAWLLSAIICNAPGHFNDSTVTELLTVACSTCTPLGSLETIANLLKVSPLLDRGF